LVDCLVRFGQGLAEVFVVLYVINVMTGTALDFGLLRALQMLTAILLYIPVARLAEQRPRKPFVLVTFVAFALFPLSLILSSNALWLIPAFVIGGLREFGEPARKATIVDLATQTRRGRAIGAYYLVRGVMTLPASLVGGVLWAINPRLPFLAGSVVAGAGALVYALNRNSRVGA
jgi:MFS family permease